MIGLTKQQSRAPTAIRAYHAQWGRVPKLDVIAADLGIARSGVHKLVSGLVSRGALIRQPNGRYRLNHEPIPTDPLAHGWRFIAVEDLGAGRAA